MVSGHRSKFTDVYRQQSQGPSSSLSVASQTLVNFSRHTNIDGVNNAGRARQTARKLLWLVLFSVGLGLTAWDVQEVQYYNMQYFESLA